MLAFAALLFLAAPTSAQPACVQAGNICFEPPSDYTVASTETKGGFLFTTLLRTGGRAELAAKLPVRKLSDMYIDSWLEGDTYRVLKLAVLPLPLEDAATPMSEIAARFHKGFASRWGSGAFAVFDSDKQIGHSINTSGAIISTHIARCGSNLVTIEAMDIVELLKLSNDNYAGSGSGSDAARWTRMRPVANTDDAEQLIENICQAALGVGH